MKVITIITTAVFLSSPLSTSRCDGWGGLEKDIAECKMVPLGIEHILDVAPPCLGIALPKVLYCEKRIMNERRKKLSTEYFWEIFIMTSITKEELDSMLFDLHEKNVEIFWMSRDEIEEHKWRDEDDEMMPEGYYGWICFPGCIPDTEPLALGTDKEAAIQEAHDWYVPE